jgi:hypothetical protein
MSETKQISIQMPTFTIDTKFDTANNKIPGVKRMLDIALAIKDSVMLWGLHGIGKSQGVYQWNAEKVELYKNAAKKWNPNVCDVRLSMKEPVDMIGIPVLSKDENGKTVTVWATPSMWPQGDEFVGGTIFLDEINQGQAAIQNAAFQLIQDRALGDYKVPDGYIIIGAANPPALNSTVTEFSIPLANRFTHFNIGVDFDCWLNYRAYNGGNPDVMAFLKTQDQSLLFDKQLLENKAGTLDSLLFTDITITPRSWEVVEKVLALPSNQFSDIEKERYCTGRLGIAVTTKFFNFVKNKEKYQSWKEILVEGKAFRSEELDQYWVTQMNCMNAITNELNDEKCRKYVLNFLAATRKLKKESLKVINATQLAKNKRLLGKFKVFNPMSDMPDLIKDIAAMLNVV